MGGEVGSSLCEEDRLETARNLLAKAKDLGVELVIPEDSVIADAFGNDAHRQIAMNHEIPAGWMGLDLGPKAIQTMVAQIQDAATILWNGPAGVFEFSNFETGTRSIAEAVAEATDRGAFSLVGGGDSAAAVHRFGVQDRVSYVSTGGGALLELLEGSTLPGVQVLDRP
jgi:phosphoglycerate kinase